MSIQFFPTLNTSSWSMTRSPQWNTQARTSATGDRKRNPLQTKPLWKWTLKKGIPQSANGDLQAIQNLYTAMYGPLDYFLWKDPEGDSIIDPTAQINYRGDYYWPVAFTEDFLNFDRFAYELWECQTLSFEQVMLPVLPQYPHGFATVIPTSRSSHLPGTNEAGFAWASVGPVAQLPAVSRKCRGCCAILRLGRCGTTYSALRSTVPEPAKTKIWFSIANSLLGSAPLDEFQIYEVALNATYEDGSTAILRPTVANAIADPQGQGIVSHPGRAVDGDPDTYASITRTSFSPGYFTSPILEVTNFVP
jgi:hypothetical protein